MIAITPLYILKNSQLKRMKRFIHRSFINSISTIVQHQHSRAVRNGTYKHKHFTQMWAEGGGQLSITWPWRRISRHYIAHVTHVTSHTRTASAHSSRHPKHLTNYVTVLLYLGYFSDIWITSGGCWNYLWLCHLTCTKFSILMII